MQYSHALRSTTSSLLFADSIRAKRRRALALAPCLMAATALASTASAQTPAVQVSTTSNVVSVNVSNATPGGLIALAVDPRVCATDVDGDRQATANDVNAILGQFGPCLTSEQKLYDLNNDGFVNQIDVDEAQAAMGCSDVQSVVIPGCNVSASVNPATMTILSLVPDASGACSIDIPIHNSLDASFYFQAVDVSSCGVSSLVPHRAMGETAFVPARNIATVAVRSDFFEPITDGLVSLSTDLDDAMTYKTAVGQIDALCDITPGSTALAMLEETPCNFQDLDGSLFRGTALGMVDTFDSAYTENPTSNIQHIIQPVAFKTRVGAATQYAPFSGIWELQSPPGTPSYDPFDAEIVSIPTRAQSTDVLNYRAVDDSVLESATCAVVIRLDKAVRLGSGPAHTRGFSIMLQNYSGFTTTPNVATRFLTPFDAAGAAPTVTVAGFDGTRTNIRIEGELSAGEYWFLLSEAPFGRSFEQRTISPPNMSGLVDEDGGSRGGCGTPSPPTNPPSVTDQECDGGLGWWNLDDCVITNNYTSSRKCKDLGPFLAATSGGAEGFKVSRDKVTTYKGSANISVSFGGVGVSVGTEISHSDTVGSEYTIGTGNGCGENLAWYVYEKHRVTRYRIKAHEWEWLIPVGWCTLCCRAVYSSCKAGETTIMEKCSRDC